MPERFVLLDERHSQFKPASLTEQTFKAENPNTEWGDLLDHLLDEYPQQYWPWRLEGSAAVALYHPNEVFPKDIDIFTPSQTFADQFGLPPDKFDVRTTEFWLKMRGFGFSEERENYLMTSTFIQKHRGRPVLTSAPSLIVFSKAHPYDGRNPRPKDMEHVAIMNLRNAESATRRVYRKLLAAT